MKKLCLYSKDEKLNPVEIAAVLGIDYNDEDESSSNNSLTI